MIGTVVETPFSHQTRTQNIAALETGLADVLVIGAGITGAGIAREAAMRGLRTAVIDRRDFGSGASSHSSRLVNGSLRYLEQDHLQLVRKANRERRHLIRIAPHLVRPISFTLPSYKGSRLSRLHLAAGFLLCEALTGLGGVPRHRRLGIRSLRAAEPNLRARGLTGGVRYWDAQCDDARLTLATVRSAHRHGALTANYVQVESLEVADGQVGGARVTDLVTGRQFTVHALLVVNATGPWSDQLASGVGARSVCRILKGVHIAVAQHKLGNNGALTVLSPIDGRVIHMVPWNELSYVGTTDTTFDGTPDECYATADDVVYLLRSANALFPHARLAPTDVVATRAGLCTLMATDSGHDSSVVTREHSLIEHESGLISVIGGSISSHRVIAFEAVDCVARALHRLDGRPVTRPAGTTLEPLPGGEVRDLEVLEEEVARDGFPREVAAHLVRAFGSETPAVTRLAMAERDLAVPVVPGHPMIAAELVHAMRREMAITLADIAIRRTNLFYEAPNHATEQIGSVADLAAREMDWDAERRAAELAAYQSEIDLNMSFRHELGSPPA